MLQTFQSRLVLSVSLDMTYKTSITFTDAEEDSVESKKTFMQGYEEMGFDVDRQTGARLVQRGEEGTKLELWVVTETIRSFVNKPANRFQIWGRDAEKNAHISDRKEKHQN